MNIAIYSQSLRRREYLQQHIVQWLRAHDMDEGISVYGESAALCDAILARRHDMAIIDLERTGDAFTAACQLRKRCMDCEIIFVSDSMELLPKAMKYRAVGYLLYPLERAELDRSLRTALCYGGARMRQYVVHTRQTDYLVPHAKISYFRSEGHYVYVHIAGEPEPIVHLRRLDDIQKEVAALSYIRCHQSYLVNLRYVERISGRFLIMKDGTQLPVSRRYAEQMVTLLDALPKRAQPQRYEACGIE